MATLYVTLINHSSKISRTFMKNGISNMTSRLSTHQSRVWFCSIYMPNNVTYNCNHFRPQGSLFVNHSVRFYAKSKDKKKGEKGQKKKVEINEETLREVLDAQKMKDQMQNSIEKMKDDYIKNLSLRSTSGSVESLAITFEGKNYVLQDVAQVVRKNPKTIVVNMVSFPQIIPTVLEAISKSGMNLNPQQDGTTLFIPVPKVTKEHREVLSKNAKALFIKCRDSIKDVQNKFIKHVRMQEKDGLAKDTSQQVCDYIMYVANEHISSAEKLLEAKQQELVKD